MLGSEHGDFLELRRERFEVELPDRLQLLLGCEDRSLHVCFVGVGQAVRFGSRRRDDGVLVQAEGGLAGAGQGQEVGDRLDGFRVGDRVDATLEGGERDTLLPGDIGEEASALRAARPDLEVGSFRAGERAAAEERAAEVGAAAAGAADDVLGRALERSAAGGEDTRFAQGLGCRFVDLDVELVARRPLERLTPVRPDLRVDARAPAGA